MINISSNKINLACQFASHTTAAVEYVLKMIPLTNHRHYKEFSGIYETSQNPVIFYGKEICLHPTSRVN